MPEARVWKAEIFGGAADEIQVPGGGGGDGIGEQDGAKGVGGAVDRVNAVEDGDFRRDFSTTSWMALRISCQ